MSERETLRTELDEGVFTITLTRASAYNTITPKLRDELAAAIDEGDAASGAHVILLRAEGRAFCAGYELEQSTANQAAEVRETPSAEMKFAPSVPLSLISPPPPISTVLHDVYPEETPATN